MTDSTVTVMSEDCEQQIVVAGTAVGVLSTLLIGFLLMIIAILLFLLKQQRNKGDGHCFMLLLIRLHVVVLCNASGRRMTNYSYLCITNVCTFELL